MTCINEKVSGDRNSMQFLQKAFWHNPQFKTASWDRPQRQLDIKPLYHKVKPIGRGEITILKNPLPNTEPDNIKREQKHGIPPRGSRYERM
jgi:hypothetical protein